MLLLTYSYVVPKEKRTEHARLLHRMRQVMTRLGCDCFEAYEQVGKQWVGGESGGRVVQMLKFRDKAHFAAVQAAEKTDPGAQQLIADFCELINLPYQQQSGMFAEGFYSCLAAPAPQGRVAEVAADDSTVAPASGVAPVTKGEGFSPATYAGDEGVLEYLDTSPGAEARSGEADSDPGVDRPQG